MSINIKISGGFTSNTNMETFAGMVGDIYGGGEYAVPESDLLSIAPDVANEILVFGGIHPHSRHESHSASTVEFELRNLFQFPKKYFVRDKKPRDKKPRDKKPRDKKPRDKKPRDKKINGAVGPVMRLCDIDTVMPHDAPLDSDNTLVASVVDDYDIANKIDKEVSSSDDESSSSESSSSESSSDDESSDSGTPINVESNAISAEHVKTPRSKSPERVQEKHQLNDNIRDDDLNIFHAIVN